MANTGTTGTVFKWIVRVIVWFVIGGISGIFTPNYQLTGAQDFVNNSSKNSTSKNQQIAIACAMGPLLPVTMFVNAVGKRVNFDPTWGP